MEWISVKDRLPEILQKVKVRFDNSILEEYMIFCESEDENKFCYITGEKTIRKVTHWMPLPEPPNQY